MSFRHRDQLSLRRGYIGDGISPHLGLNQHTHEHPLARVDVFFRAPPVEVELEPVHRMGNENDNERNGEEERNARRANPIDIHVGSRVKYRRISLGMSQEKLGERLGLTFQQIQKYEKGVNRIGASRLFELSCVLQVPVQFFFDGLQAVSTATGLGEPPSEPYRGPDVILTREGLELNKAFARISDARVRKAVVELVRSLAGDATRD